MFGGDPSNVTLMGHGTGAACVGFLMASSAVPDGKCIGNKNNIITYCNRLLVFWNYPGVQTCLHFYLSAARSVL